MSTRRIEPIEDRFFRKVDAVGICWVWTGYCNKDGYGRFNRGAQGMGVASAHRWAYEYLVGAIPAGMTLDHLCRNRKCVNPDHLEIVTRGANVLRGHSSPAANARKTRCKHGHEFTHENTYDLNRHHDGRVGRCCRQCALIAQARRYRNRVAALRIVGGSGAA